MKRRQGRRRHTYGKQFQREDRRHNHTHQRIEPQIPCVFSMKRSAAFFRFFFLPFFFYFCFLFPLSFFFPSFSQRAKGQDDGHAGHGEIVGPQHWCDGNKQHGSEKQHRGGHGVKNLRIYWEQKGRRRWSKWITGGFCSTPDWTACCGRSRRRTARGAVSARP
jgi:hypothetical protein